MKGVVTTGEFRAEDYEAADVVLCAVLYSDIHASFRVFAQSRIPDIERQIRGRLVLIVPETAPEGEDGLPGPVSSPGYASILGVAERNFPCLAFFAGTEGGHATVFSLKYRKDPDDYVDDFYQTIMTAIDVRTSVGLSGETDPNIIVHRRGEVIDELQRLHLLGKLTIKGRDVVAGSTISNLIRIARFIGWAITGI